MLYLNAAHIENIGIAWENLVDVIAETVITVDRGDYAQPIKPYLRYGNPNNRIIAMPAYIGGHHPFAGIKWIASFPDNIFSNKLRANSITILNEFDTGVPVCTINTSLLSAIRTASVSGLMVKKYIQFRQQRGYSVGIVGLGPIGLMHLKMLKSLLGKSIERIYLFDIRKVDIEDRDQGLSEDILICGSWEECYTNSDIFIACTVASERYIDRKPKIGSLQLNVSLRDYKVEVRKYMDVIVVDDWDEVCRQNTDIENMQKETGLEKADTFSMSDFLLHKCPDFENMEKTIMFNPMGMAVFDIAIGGYYYHEALKENIGTMLPD